MVPSAHCDVLLVEMGHVVMKMYGSLEVVSADGLIFMLWGQGCYIHSSIPASEVYSQDVIKLLPCVLVHSAMQCLLKPANAYVCASHCRLAITHAC